MGTFLRQLFLQQRISDSFRNKLFQPGTVPTNVLATEKPVSVFVGSATRWRCKAAAIDTTLPW
jgi:hypothetical protein